MKAQKCEAAEAIEQEGEQQRRGRGRTAKQRQIRWSTVWCAMQRACVAQDPTKLPFLFQPHGSPKSTSGSGKQLTEALWAGRATGSPYLAQITELLSSAVLAPVGLPVEVFYYGLFSPAFFPTLLRNCSSLSPMTSVLLNPKFISNPHLT